METVPDYIYKCSLSCPSEVTYLHLFSILFQHNALLYLHMFSFLSLHSATLYLLHMFSFLSLHNATLYLHMFFFLSLHSALLYLHMFSFLSLHVAALYLHMFPFSCHQVVRVHLRQHSASLCVYTSSPFLSTDCQSTSLSTQCLTICIHSVNTASLYVYTGSPFLSTVGESTSLSAQCLNDNYYMYTHVPLSCLQIVRVHLYLHSAILRVHMLGVPTAVDG